MPLNNPQTPPRPLPTRRPDDPRRHPPHDLIFGQQMNQTELSIPHVDAPILGLLQTRQRHLLERLDRPLARIGRAPVGPHVMHKLNPLPGDRARRRKRSGLRREDEDGHATEAVIGQGAGELFVEGKHGDIPSRGLSDN